VYAAAKVLGLKVVSINSVGASMFGATDPEFTWLDMDSFLYEKGIFPYKTKAASIGGGRDLGRGLNVLGRDMILKAIERNDVQMVRENDLDRNINRKMEIYKSSYKKYEAYINIRWWISSIGSL